MRDGEIPSRNYFREYFNIGCILRGEVKYLEEIKEYIIEYVEKGLVKLIKPTYSKNPISMVTEGQRWDCKEGPSERADDFNFACVLRGEVKYLEEIKEYIVREYVEKELVNLVKIIYSKDKIFIHEARRRHMRTSWIG